MILEKSVAAFNLAKKFMPGGVNSPVRSFKSVDCSPPFISHAKGSHIFDIDGNDYVDYVGSWGPMILGHAHQKVVDALKKAVERGTSYGAPTELETNLAALVQKFYPSMQVLRMVNSGTEATMSALRVARGFTRRDKIVKFIGCYHGHCDSLLVNAGSGAATFGEPSSPGVTKNIAQDTIALPYNDIDAVKKIFAECGEQIACVIVEPIAGNMGLVLPEINFLPALREVTKKFGALLIFDEVMCGFRNNVQATIQPDLTCLGKVIGGGLPCAAYGGKAEIMRNVSPDGKIYQAGTLSGNPLAMTAGITTLEILLDTPNFIADLNKKTSALVEGLKNIFGAGVQVPQAGSMFSIFFADKKVTNYAKAAAANQEFFKRWFIKMLERGIYLAPSQFETLFVSAAHSDADIEKTLAAAKRSFADAAKKN